MLSRSRSGMALLTVVLISALIFVSIVGIAARVVPENKMIASRSASERALTAAEAGLSQALFNLRNTNFTSPGTTLPVGTTDSSLAYLSFSNVKDIAMADVSTTPFVYDPAPVPGGGATPYVTYQVKIQKTSGDSSLTQMPTMGLTIYSLGTVLDKVGGTVMARKAIVLDVSVAYTTSTVVKAAILAGETIKFNGNGNTVTNGDAWTGGDIKKGGTERSFIIEAPGTAYATGAIDSGVAEQSVTHAASPSTEIDTLISKLELAYSKDSADAFRNGTGVYDGSAEHVAAGYPSTNRSLLLADKTVLDGIFTNYLGDSKNFARVASFYPDLKSGKILNDYRVSLTPAGRAFLESLRSFTVSTDPLVPPPNADKVVVYYDGGDVTGDMLATAHVGGTLVIKNDFKMNGGTVNYDAGTFPVGVNPLTLRVMGAVDLGGNGALVANIFASGENSAKKPEVSINGTSGGSFKFAGYVVTTEDAKIGGNVNIYGSVVAESTVDIGGTNSITYVDTGLGTIEGPRTPSVAAVQSSWKEVSFDKFSNPNP